MKQLARFVVLAYLVSWKAVGMGEKACDYNEYTGAEVHCQVRDVPKEKWFNTKAGADEFVANAPKKGVKDMEVAEKENDRGYIVYRGN